MTNQERTDAPAIGPPKVPLWVKVFGAIGLVVLVLVVVLLIVGGSEHGPGRHLGSDDAGGDATAHSLAATPLGEQTGEAPATLRSEVANG